MFSYCSLIGNSDKISTAVDGDTGSDKRNNSGAYKNEGVIY